MSIREIIVDIDKLAEMAARKKNRKIAERYPMFAEQFATTPEAEKERIILQREQAEKHLEALRKSDVEAWERGMMYRSVAREILPAEEWERHEKIWERWHPDATPEYNGCHLADFWWGALFGSEYAFEHCPNREMHDDPSWCRQPHWNYMANEFVETTECPTCGMKRPKPDVGGVE